MSTSPVRDRGFSPFPSPETPALKLAELVRLQKFAQRITSTLDIEELVPRIVDEVATSLGCVEINLYLHDPQQNEFILACVRGCTFMARAIAFQWVKEWSDTSRSRAKCTTLPMSPATPTTWRASQVRAPKLPFRCNAKANWSEFSPFPIASSTLSVLINYGCCRDCALT